MRILESRAFLTGFAALVLFSGLAADAWRNSISWYGYGVIVLGITVVSVLVLVRHRRSIRLASVPRPLLAFLLLVTASLAWSAYPGATALGVTAQSITTAAGLAIALVLASDELVRALGWALRAILALSVVFELVVSLVIRTPVLPVWATAEDRADPPVILYWSRNNLLEGERIQGIVGSWSLLGMVAVLALIVFSVQLAARRVRRAAGIGWIALAALTVVLTRSATIYLAIAAVIVVLGMVLLVRRTPPGRARTLTYAAMTVAVAVLVSLVVMLREPLLSALGKSPDLTGRLDIWNAVIGLAQQRPAFGWGWVSFWPPWAEPFAGLVRKNGVMQLHAHNAWLDVWLQLGVAGLVVFGALIATTVVRSWSSATDRLVTDARELGRHTAESLLPLLVVTALLVQSLAESRLLLEGGWLLLVVFATATKGAKLGRAAPVPARPQRLPVL